jgi:hypothetical protein
MNHENENTKKCEPGCAQVWIFLVSRSMHTIIVVCRLLVLSLPGTSDYFETIIYAVKGVVNLQKFRCSLSSSRSHVFVCCEKEKYHNTKNRQRIMTLFRLTLCLLAVVWASPVLAGKSDFKLS